MSSVRSTGAVSIVTRVVFFCPLLRKLVGDLARHSDSADEVLGGPENCVMRGKVRGEHVLLLLLLSVVVGGNHYGGTELGLAAET